MQKHVQDQINFIKFTMKYVLIVDLFGIVDVNSTNLV